MENVIRASTMHGSLQVVIMIMDAQRCERGEKNLYKW